MSVVFLMHPDLVRDEVGIQFTKVGVVDSAGYRCIDAMVSSFQQAGMQLQAFRAAEFDGDLSLNPLHRQYVDPVDRDAAIKDAILRGKQASEDFKKARKLALDKKSKEREDEIVRVAERIRRARDARSVQSESVPAEESPPTSE